jgi:HPt (histidine-containing phosphotransfer) domain-containing protein
MAADPAAVIEALKQRFLRRAGDDLALLLRGRATGAQAWAEMRFIVHRLNGAAGTFGYPALSTAASWVETQWPAGGGPDPVLLDALIAALEALPDPDGPSPAATG